MIKNLSKSQLSTLAILGTALQESDETEDYIRGDNYYQWYYALGAAIKPRAIIEFGVRYGYSLLAMIKGARSASENIPIAYGFDSEFDLQGSCDIAWNTLKDWCVASIQKIDTTDEAAIRCPFLGDIVHVDADHSPEGVVRELKLAHRMVSPTGIIVVDDTEAAHIREAAINFARENGYTMTELSTLRGMAVLYTP